MRKEITSLEITCDICGCCSNNENDFESHKYPVVHYGYQDETRFEKASQFTSKLENLDLCNMCHVKSLDQTIKYKTISYSSDVEYGFWNFVKGDE